MTSPLVVNPDRDMRNKRDIKNIIVTTGIVLGLTFPILYAVVAFIPKGRGYISTLHFGKDISREDAYIDDFEFRKGLFRKSDANNPSNFVFNDGTDKNELHGKYVTIDTRSFDIRDPVYSRGIYCALSNTQSTTIQDDSVIEVSCNPLTKDFDLPFFRKFSNRFSRNPGYTHVINFKCISFPVEEDVAIQDLRFDFTR